MPRHGTWTETGGGGRKMLILLVIAAVIVLAIAGGAAAGIIAALTVFLTWIAVIMGIAVFGVIAYFFLTRGKREQANIDMANLRELQRQRYYAELDERHARRAAINAQSQAAAWAPMAGLIAEAIHGNKAEPQPAWKYRAEIVPEADK